MKRRNSGVGVGVRTPAHGALVLLVAGIGLLLGACSSSLEMRVQPDVPAPAINQLPIHIGVHYPPSLSQHVFEEDSEDRGVWRIETGQAQMAMFQQILPAMCARIHQVSDNFPLEHPEIDAVLSPNLESMQLALPEESPFGFYEAWLRYKMHLLDPDGSLIAEWWVTGYGKVSNPGTFSSREENLNAAISAALRDAGGQFALDFRKQPAVRNWLCTKPMAENTMCQNLVDAF